MLPQVGFENFGSGQESKNGSVAFGDGTTGALCEKVGAQKRARREGNACCAGFLEE